jgi:predicted RNA-binding protein YlxR (DUF448 family)
VRLVREADGTVVADVKGSRPGRGAYVCADQACIERGFRRDRLVHAFRASSHAARDLAESVLARQRGATARASVE